MYACNLDRKKCEGVEMKRQYKIAIVDDHPLVRNALSSVISGMKHCIVHAECSNGQELISLLQSKILPDLILLDISMPIMDGLSTAEWLKENHPQISIIVLTAFSTDPIIMKLLSLGVNCVMSKNINASEFKKGILAVMEKGIYLPHDISNNIFRIIASKGASLNNMNKHILSEKEIVFLRLVSTEMTYKEIAQSMNISPRTIDKLRDKLFERYELKSRTGLVKLAIHAGIIIL